MKSLTNKYWSFPADYKAQEVEKRHAREFRVNPEIIRLLRNRGICEREEIRKYLYPTLADLESPENMKGLPEACEILREAILKGDDIIIWGDYDVDGISATSLLIRFFRMIRVEVTWFVPDRFEDGYGLSIAPLKKIFSRCISHSPVLVTVDCGISNYEEIVFAKKHGCRVIVTDHHLPGEKLVGADVVVNPHQEGCLFGNKDLSGVGIAFYLAMALRTYLRATDFFKTDNDIPNIKQLLEFVALGTVADMVPLQGDNRILVKAGFEAMNAAPSTGVSALLKESDICSANITSEDLVYQVAPKINAAGRLDQASMAVELLVEESRDEARHKAKKLSRLNDKRKTMCRECLESTLDNFDISLTEGYSCYIAMSEYSIGILGIVASQLVEKIHRPVILVSSVKDKIYGTVLKGSCRSIPGINIFELLQSCEEYLVQYGGHPMAAGVTIREKHFEKFRTAMQEKAADIGRVVIEPETIDMVLDIEQATSQNLAGKMHLLEPFGPGNEKPLFVDKNIIIQETRRIGRNGDHLTFFKRGRFEKSKCIAFGFGDYIDQLKERKTFDAVYSLMLSRYKKAERWQANLVDII